MSSRRASVPVKGYIVKNVRPSSLLRPEGRTLCASVPVKGYIVKIVRPSSLLRSVGTHALCVRPRQRLHRQDRSTTDAQIVRPYRTQSRLVSSRRTSVVVQRYDFCMVTRVDWATYIVWQIVRNGRPILMGQKSPTRHGTKKSQGRDFKIPTEGRRNPHGGTKWFQGRDEKVPTEGCRNS